MDSRLSGYPPRRVELTSIGVMMPPVVRNTTMQVAMPWYRSSDDLFMMRKRRRELEDDDCYLHSIVRPRRVVSMDKGQDDCMVVSVGGSSDGGNGSERFDDWSLDAIVRSSANTRRVLPERMEEGLYDVNVDQERPMLTMNNSEVVMTSVVSGCSSDQGVASAATLPINKYEWYGGGAVCDRRGSSDCEIVVSQNDIARVATYDQRVSHPWLPICKQESLRGGDIRNGSLNSASKAAVAQQDNARVANCGTSVSVPEDSGDLGSALTDSLTAEEIKDHLRSFNRSNNLGGGITRPDSIDNETCQLCLQKKLTFAAPPKDCAQCGKLLKSSSTFYMIQKETGTLYYFCTHCKSSRGGTMKARELSFSKDQLVKVSSVDGVDEPWVQCDECQCWQHQTCALYNNRVDLEENMRYTCPFCRLAELEAGKHKILTAPLGAGDLPRTILSDHIEQRLLKNLAQERMQRAKLLGKSAQEVPGAEDLGVRVVLATDKQIKVKQPFLDVIQGKTYPLEFPYKSKVILLFQKIDGVEVCLFAMYVEEFGSECEQPNKRSVYISYLDSVRYFTPEVKSVTGVPLRTFVYHEVLIGYLDYCKKRGFATGYIWACPPLKGDDYILYCHPKTQKTPKTDHLRKWYKTMLKKALAENVVTEWTNFYNHFFLPNDKTNNKITVARLPYFDGSYWTGAIEDFMLKMEKPKRLLMRELRRTLKSMGRDGQSADSMKDIEVMQKLGDKIQPMKDDFMVVHLQHICKSCHEVTLPGSCWSCETCGNYHLCAGCVDAKQSPDGSRTHATINGEKHSLSQISVNDVAVDTKDKDVTIQSDIFETRQSFLNFCQTRNYQFDTLLHAKHSTMMILYQLHNTSLSSRGTICSVCHQDVPVGMHCETCSEFYICKACYQKEGNGCHAHKLSKHLVKPKCKTKGKKVQRKGAPQLKRVLDVLAHATRCQTREENTCPYPHCHNMKRNFHHIRNCKAGQQKCKTCDRIWSVLDCHSLICQDSNCTTPGCSESKIRIAQAEAQHQADSRELKRKAARAEALRRAGYIVHLE